MYEAVELRDDDPKRYLGKGVEKAVGHVEEDIAKELIGVEVTDQRYIDELMIELDGTDNKSKLGANEVLDGSLAAEEAAASERGLCLIGYIGGVSADLLSV